VTEAGNVVFLENFRPFPRFYVKICSSNLRIFTFIPPKIPFFVPEKRPKNTFFVQKRHEKGVPFSKKGGKMMRGMRSGLWIFSICFVKKSSHVGATLAVALKVVKVVK
jgi:hypothetical protein